MNHDPHQSAPKSSFPRFKEVDVLRGLAAMTVVLSHYNPFWARYNYPIPVLVEGSYGHNAVLLFFVTSGFVIFMTLDKCRTVLDFAVLRFSRLYPVYWATLIFATLVRSGIFGRDLWVSGFLANLTMFQEFVRFPNLDNVYWSLTVELAFYLNVAWVLALGLHRYRRRVIATWLLVSCLWALTLHQPEVEQRSLLAILFAFDYAAYFCVGVTLFDVVKRGWSGAAAALIGLALLTQALVSGLHDAGLLVLATAAMGLALSGKIHFVVNRVTLWLGAISYSLYLIHRNIGYLLLEKLHEAGLGAMLSIFLVTALALLLASFFTYVVEQPVQKRIRRTYTRWQSTRSQK